MALEANSRNLRAFEHQKRMAMVKREALRAQAVTEKERLENLQLTLTAHAGEEGKLFGSVTNLDLERALREQGYAIDRRRILLSEPIKQLGDYSVIIRLQPEVDANLRFSVTALKD
jgi:large subunit ribosomal protein L9